MPADDNEVLAYLSKDPQSLGEIDLLTFALYAADKTTWMQGHFDKTQSFPDEAAVRSWIENWTPLQFERLRGTAIEYFDRAAREYLSTEIEEYQEKVRNDAILREVRRAGSFGRQFFLAVVTAILAPLILAGALLLAGNVKNIPTPSDLAAKFAAPAPNASKNPPPESRR